MSDWWEELFQRTISAHREGNRKAGMEACERLLSRPGLPWEIEQHTRMNQTWYLEPLAATGSGSFTEPPYRNSTQISLWHQEGWSLFNPSIAANPAGELRMIVRSSNYTIADSGQYVILNTDGIIRTTNYLCKVEPRDDRSWWVHDPLPVKIDTWGKYEVQGIEDCRLYADDRWFGTGGWTVSGTVRDRHPDGICEIMEAPLTFFDADEQLEEWGEELDDEEDCWLSIDRSIVSDNRRHEKNWMPFADGITTRQFRWLYSSGPTIVFTPGESGVRDHWTYDPGPWVARSFRGGSQMVPLDHGHYLGVVHESVDFPPGTVPRRVYQHRFIELSDDYPSPYLTRISEPFSFHGRGIEFAAGMVLLGEDLVISYGVNDATAWLLRLPLEQALGMMKEPYGEDL